MQEQQQLPGAPLPEDGFESFPLESSEAPAHFDLPSDDDWMDEFADEAPAAKVVPAGCVIVEHQAPALPTIQTPFVPIKTPQTPTGIISAWPRRAMVFAAVVAIVAPIPIARGLADRRAAAAAQIAGSLQTASADTRSPVAESHPIAVPLATPLDTPQPKVTAATVNPKNPVPPLVQKPAAVAANRTVSAPPEPATPAPVKPVADVTSTETPTPTPLSSPTVTATASTPILTSTPTSTPTPTATPTPSPTATRSASAPAAAAAPSPREAETAGIRWVVERYRQAFGSLDASAIAAFWPTANLKGLTNAFGQLEAQTFTFDSCGIDITGEQAVVACTGRASFTPKVGSRTPRVESRRWTFRLARMSDRWVILSVESR